MCLVLLVGTHHELPPIPVDPARQSIAVTDLTGHPVLSYGHRLLSTPYVYDVAARDGCGCGFRYRPEDAAALGGAAFDEDAAAALNASLDDLQAVASLVAPALANGPVQLFYCWDTELYTVSPDRRRTIPFDMFAQRGFYLPARELLVITESSKECS